MNKLRDYAWKCKYTPSSGDLLKEFYIPALSCAVRYDRTTGYFSAEALAAASKGVEALVRNHGKMRLIVGCTLEQEEVEAIQKGESLKGTVQANLLRTPFIHDTQQLQDGLELLAWMVAKAFLEIRVAVPVDPQTKLVLSSFPIFHEKAGIIEDGDGERLVFNGSLNETLQGWTKNWDTFHVFCSWENDARHLDEDEETFRRLWANQEATAIVLAIDDVIQQRLFEFLPQGETLPRRLQEVKGDTPCERKDTTTSKEEQGQTKTHDDAKDAQQKAFAEMWHFLHEAPKYSPTGDRVGEATSAVTPWPHQWHAFERMYSHWPPKLLIADEVGLGKTIQAGLLIRQAWLAQKAKRILILAPKAVLGQWQIELREKFNLNIPIYDGNTLTWYDSPARYGHNKESIEKTTWHTQDLLITSSHLMRRKERAQQILEEAQAWDLIILDEAHHARRKGGFTGQRNRPNQLLGLMRKLKYRTQGLLLLTATPMQVDPLEVWDLLSLLDMPEPWSSDAFLHFFELAVRPSPTAKELLVMAPLFRAMEEAYGAMSLDEALRLDPNHDKFITKKVLKALRENSAIPMHRLSSSERDLAQRLMKAYSPTQKLISRHTRELLRTYHQAGKLTSNIATRNVQDFFVPLSTAERELYDAVEDYISEAYDQAAQKERTAVGFVMTIYRRRLASSFYALSQTLQNRLRMLENKLNRTSTLSEDDLPDDELGDEYTDLDEAKRLEQQALRADEATQIKVLLHDTQLLPIDSKIASLVSVLDALHRQGYEQVVIFTQYTDSLDFLREQLCRATNDSLLCFSGRGGERLQSGQWQSISRDMTKQLFRDGEAKILLCTDAAAEGLNFQFCGALINYDMPWNPMHVEQRIGRIDRLGQRFNEIQIINLMYANTIEADIYKALRTRIGLFGTFIGKLQPILSKLPRAFSELALKTRAQQSLACSQTLANIDADIQKQQNSSFDLDEIAYSDLSPQAMTPPAYDLAYLHRVLLTPTLLPVGHTVTPLAGGKDFKYTDEQGRAVRVTTDPEFFEAHAESVELWSPGSPAFPW